MAVEKLVKWANTFKTTLSEDEADNSNFLNLNSVTGLPSISGDEYFYLTLIRTSDQAIEIVKVTQVGPGLGVVATRAQDGTSALAFSDGDTVVLANNAALLTDIQSEIVTQLDKISFADAGATDHQDDTETNTIAKIASDASDQVLIVLGAGTYTFADDYTVAKGVTLRFEGGAQLSVASGKTVTIDGQIEAPLEDLFTGSGDVEIGSGQDIPAEWFGAVSYATNGESSPADAGLVIQTAFDQCGTSKIVLTDGFYYCTTSITLGNMPTTNSVLKVSPSATLLAKSVVGLDLMVEAGRWQVFGHINTVYFVSSLYNSTVYPEWFGAAVDWTTDSTGAIQDAIDVSRSAATIEFDKSTRYIVSDDLDVKVSSKNFRGGVLYRYTTSGRAIFNVDKDYCSFADMTLDMSNVATGNCSGIYGNSADYMSVRNVVISKPRADIYNSGNLDSGVYLNDCDYATIDNVTVIGGGTATTGISVEECEDCIISNCLVNNVSTTGVDIVNGKRVQLTDSNIVTSAEMGVWVRGFSSGAGLGEYNSVNGNTITSTAEEGVVVDGSTGGNIDHTRVQDNTIVASDVDRTGVEFRGTCVDGMVLGNHIEGFSYGVGTTGATSNLLVATNHLMGCSTETIIHSSSTNTKVLSNMKGATLTEAHAIITEDLATSAAGTGGSGNVWSARKCNKIEADTAGMVASIDGGTGEFDLVPGTYKIRAFCPVTNSDGTQSRIYDVTNSKAIANGLSVTSQSGGDNDEFNISIVSGVLSIGSTTTLRIETIASNSWISCSALSDVSITNAERSVGTLVEITKISTQAISTVDLSGENHWTYEFDASGSVDIGTYKIGELPDNAIVTRAWYRVETTFTSTTGPDNATISLGIANDDVEGIVAPIAINDGSNPWDAGNHDCIQDGTLANFSEITDGVQDVQAIVAVDNLTAGKLYLHLTFVVNED